MKFYMGVVMQACNPSSPQEAERGEASLGYSKTLSE